MCNILYLYFRYFNLFIKFYYLHKENLEYENRTEKVIKERPKSMFRGSNCNIFPRSYIVNI